MKCNDLKMWFMLWVHVIYLWVHVRSCSCSLSSCSEFIVLSASSCFEFMFPICEFMLTVHVPIHEFMLWVHVTVFWVHVIDFWVHFHSHRVWTRMKPHELVPVHFSSLPLSKLPMTFKLRIKFKVRFVLSWQTCMLRGSSCVTYGPTRLEQEREIDPSLPCSFHLAYGTRLAGARRSFTLPSLVCFYSLFTYLAAAISVFGHVGCTVVELGSASTFDDNFDPSRSLSFVSTLQAHSLLLAPSHRSFPPTAHRDLFGRSY